MSFADMTVIVTGAGRGIGRAVALAFASEKARVVLAESDSAAGQIVEDEIRTSGGTAVFIRTDVSEPADIEELVKQAVSRFGRIDILVNNAGISTWASPFKLSVEEWDHIINTNLRGTFLCSRIAAVEMRKTGGGSVINIASTRAFMSEPGWEAYASSKGGIVALTHALAASFAPYGIRVNCISPGWIETRDYESLREADHKQHFSGRVGKPDDIARACLYLAAPGNEFINGENIIIDGGMTRRMSYEE